MRPGGDALAGVEPGVAQNAGQIDIGQTSPVFVAEEVLATTTSILVRLVRRSKRVGLIETFTRA
jgi:hypothetical protein